MPHSIENNAQLIFPTLVFVAVVLLLWSLYKIWSTYRSPQAFKLGKRLQSLAISNAGRAEVQLLKRQVLSDVPILERLLIDISKAQVLQKFILQSGLNWTVSTLLLSCAVSGCVAFVLVSLLASQPGLIGMLAGALAASIPFLYMYKVRGRRMQQIERQLPDAIELLIRALHSGHALSSGLKMIGDDMPEPIANEFRTVHEEIKFGVPLNDALAGLSERVPLTDVRYFAVAVMIQRDAGGNMNELLGNLSRLIRDRLKFTAKVRVLSAEGRLSAWILSIMPFAMAGLMRYLNPEFISLLWTDPIGVVILQYLFVLMVFGILMLKKIGEIRV